MMDAGVALAASGGMCEELCQVVIKSRLHHSKPSDQEYFISILKGNKLTE